MKKVIKLFGIAALAAGMGGKDATVSRQKPSAFGGVFAKRKLQYIITAGMLLLCTGCVSTKIVPLLYTNNESSEFEILGEILYESKDRPGYIGLLGAARELYPDCDYVIDIMAEQRITTKIVFFFWATEEVIWVMRGTAIKYKI